MLAKYFELELQTDLASEGERKLIQDFMLPYP